jgi:hypothetical protein
MGILDGITSALSSGEFWSKAIPVLGAAGFTTIAGLSGNNRDYDREYGLQEQALSQNADYQNRQLELSAQRMAMEKEIAAANRAMMKKQLIQRAYAELVNAALQGGIQEANALANLGTVGQRAVLGGSR